MPTMKVHGLLVDYNDKEYAAKEYVDSVVGNTTQTRSVLLEEDSINDISNNFVLRSEYDALLKRVEALEKKI
ncbi:hypothetical protein TRFO_38944 [Tritrichomonas foetus]|uniref:Uncharacterized protein n=1 Tax=Tritrichomonas foetus TaxID=1144522 RepID=A0A1J4JC58_9EUKA|nr:hypothetical protein TRFO_38944 [Tritrichomonas foetus]|eukprot:OHS94844.1 hypothetical protein TRFO_38944 [Tritrichomonas foetus]